MIKKRQILINSIFSVIQILVISIVLFFLYRFLLNTLGVEQLGLWSLILATTSVTQIANLGLSGSVVKFVAKYVALKDSERVSRIIQTAVISVAAFVGFILIIGYPLIKFFLGLVVPDRALLLAFSILPFAFVALWIMAMTSIFHAGLDGYQRIDLRSCVLMGGAILHLLLCFILAPKFGLVGVAYARIIQNTIVFLSSWFLLKKCFPVLPFFPFRWDKRSFKEIIRYGVNFQIITVTAIFFNPVTKALLSKFGDLSMVGYFEMSSRMIQQLRSLIVSANQVLVPAIAELKEKTPDKIQAVYLASYRLLFYFALPLYSLLIVVAPLISEIWIGHYEKYFVIFTILLSVGWFFNTLNVPAYFANLGTGELRWNVFGHLAVAVLNVGLGFFLGSLYGGIGVVIGCIVALALGSSLIYISYHYKHRIPFIELLPKASKFIILACLLGIVSSLILQNKLMMDYNLFGIYGLISISFLLLLGVFLWMHPIRTQLVKWIENELIKRG